MVLVILGMLLALALALVVVGLVAVPAVREGETLLGDGRGRVAREDGGLTGAGTTAPEAEVAPGATQEATAQEAVGASR